MTNASLIPEQGIRVGLNTAYLVTDQIVENTQYANEWAAKTDGLVRNTDYSAKAYAIGGTGTETNNALYYKNQASASATNASTSATSAANSVNGFQGVVDTATSDFNSNATTKTTAFNTNATAKQALVDASATSAQASATSAQQYAQDAKGFSPIGSLTSIPCTADYIPDGCLPCDGYEYSKSQFKTLWTNYLTSSPVKLQTCTYAEYATAISTYGFCDKFAVDTTALTFKVPTRPNKAYIGVNGTAPVKGNGMTVGLTNGSQNSGLWANTQYGAFVSTSAYNVNVDTTAATTGTLINGRLGVTTDPTKSGIIADTSNLIKESTDIRWFVVVANAQINQSQMDWSAWATSLAGKANTDLSNITATGKETVVGWGMPDYSAGVSVTIPTTGYILEKESYVIAWTTVQGGDILKFFGGSILVDGQRGETSGASTHYVRGYFPAGANLKLAATPSGEKSGTAIIYPLNGVN